MSLIIARINKDGSPSCAEYRLRLRGNYRDKDMPRYDLNIEIFDTIRYIVPSLLTSIIQCQRLLLNLVTRYRWSGTACVRVHSTKLLRSFQSVWKLVLYELMVNPLNICSGCRIPTLYWHCFNNILLCVFSNVFECWNR